MATVKRLNYIGSKFKLLDWLTESIQAKTGWTSFEGKRVADLFGGTGIVSHHFRTKNATVLSNDAELYSSIITRAFTTSVYTEKVNQLIAQLNQDIQTNSRVGYITKHYSPYEGNERMFFTTANAQKIDYLRARVEELKTSVSEDEYIFLLASLIVSADAVGNVPSVYGAYLKKFKDRASRALEFVPIHTLTTLPAVQSKAYNKDVLSDELLQQIEADVVYLDPPYNERQYSKNYFPLNMIAKTPAQLASEPALKGKTGIPTDCFISPFCKKQGVEGAFETLFQTLKTKWIFVSYNSESLLSKEKMLELMGKYGKATVIERDQKRFKNYEYNEDKAIQEYLFCLEKSS